MTAKFNAGPTTRSMTKDHELIVTITYTGLKATRFFSKQSQEAVIQLKKDLTELKFPSPKNQNVSFVSHGCMKAFWIAPLNSHVYRCLHSAVNQEPVGNQPHFRLYTQKDLNRLGIKRMLLDKRIYHPWLQQTAPSTSSVHDNQGQTHASQTQSQTEGQQVQDVAPLAYTSAFSAIKHPAPQERDPSLGSNKRARFGPPESRSFGTGANATPPMHNSSVVLPSIRFGATAAAQTGGTAWLPQSQLSFGPPPSTLSMQMLTQWNHQQAQVPRTLGQTPNVQMQGLNAAFQTQAQAQSNLQQTTENGSVLQAQIRQFQSNPWKALFLTQPNPEGRAGVAAATTVTTQSQTQPNGAQMQSRTVQVQPQGSQAPQRTHISSTPTATGMDASNPAPVQQQSDQTSPIFGDDVAIRPSTTPAIISNETEGSTQQLEGRLATVRRELDVQLQQELKIYQQIQQIEPAPVTPRDQAFLISVQDLRSKVAELEKMLEESGQKVSLVQERLGVVQRGRKKVDDELLEERKSRMEVEDQLNNERARLAQINEELRREMMLRVEAEAQLHNEKKGRAEVEEELQKERMIRAEAEGYLQDERQGRAEEVRTERTLRAEAEARLQDERKGWAEIDAELQAERKSRMDVEAELEVVRAQVVGAKQIATEEEPEIGELKQEDPWDQLEDERKRRLKTEETLGEERRRRAEAEHLLKDVERECRAPFVVPALLEAFATISRITSRALEANASRIISG